MERAPFLGTRAIFEIALALAREAGSWDALRMHDVARAANMSVADLLRRVPDRDALAEIAFDVADEAMRTASEDPAWTTLPPRERCARCVQAWLAALPPERKLVRGMLAYKMHPEHLHLQAQGIMRISRTVQTMRELSLLRATGLRREIEEAALTTWYLAKFARWLLRPA
jgi:ubiquinone biosynthesis protein COQ9